MMNLYYRIVITFLMIIFFAVQDEISKIVPNHLVVELTLGSEATTWMSYLNTLEQYKLFVDWRSAYQRRTDKDYYA